MTKLELIMILLPIVFMIHEYEEIIMFKYWLGNNRNELKRRFPKFEQFLTHRGHFDYSTATFAVGTAHEFLLIAAISFCSLWLGAYHWWFAAFAGYSIHLIVHLNGMALDRYTSLSFQVHIVQDLILQIFAGDGVGIFEQPIGQGTLAVVDMCNNAEVADILHRCLLRWNPLMLMYDLFRSLRSQKYKNGQKN